MPTTTTTQVFDYSKWTAQLPELSKKYQSANPYPHIVLENFLDPEVLKDCIAEFNRLNETDGWINYKHYNEDKRGLNKIDLLPETIKSTINELNSPAFLEWLSAITGIRDLQKDEGLEGGGIHQSTRGGFLNIHADFTVHPHHRNWQRRVNVLVYLNEDWKEDWGGKLELWDRKMKACEASVFTGLQPLRYFQYRCRLLSWSSPADDLSRGNVPPVHRLILLYGRRESLSPGHLLPGQTGRRQQQAAGEDRQCPVVCLYGSSKASWAPTTRW